MSKLKDKAKIVAEFLNEMEEKYPLTDYDIRNDVLITAVYDKNISSVIVYKIESDNYDELERIEVK